MINTGQVPHRVGAVREARRDSVRELSGGAALHQLVSGGPLVPQVLRHPTLQQPSDMVVRRQQPVLQLHLEVAGQPPALLLGSAMAVSAALCLQL